MDLFKSISNIKYIFSSFALNSDIKVVPIVGNDAFNLFIKVVPPGRTATLDFTEKTIEFYQIVEGHGVLHITDINENSRSFFVKTGDSFIFESHSIQKIENPEQTRLVVILGSHASHHFYDEKNISLTDRQLQVLFFLLRGKTIKQIAKILELSHRTVDDYLEQLRIKFSAQNKYELINKAISYGFLNTVPESLFRLRLATI